MLIEYFRKSNSRDKKGVMVAIPDHALCIVSFGFSLCNTKDKFDKKLGLKIASNRAIKQEPGIKEFKIPSSMKKSFKKFQKRCMRYYKGMITQDLSLKPLEEEGEQLNYYKEV